MSILSRRSRASIRSIVLAFACVGGAVQPAFAEWRLVPFVGAAVGARTGYFDPDNAVDETRVVWGASVSRNWNRVSIDIEFADVPGFFTGGGDDNVITNSNVLLLSSNLTAQLPRLGRVRPYAVAGLGALYVRSRDQAAVFPVSDWQPALTAGGGISIPITPRLGIVTDVRYTRSRRGDGAESSIGFGTTYVDFWRSSIGLALGF